MNKKIGLVLVMGVLYSLFVSTTASAEDYHVFIIDNSESMAFRPYNTENTRLEAAVAMAESMVPNKALANVRIISLLPSSVSYDTTAELLTPDWIVSWNDPEGASNSDLVRGIIHDVGDTVAGWTPLAEAICLGAEQFEDVPAGTHRRYLHVFTDGFENNTHAFSDCFGDLSIIDFKINTHTPHNQAAIDAVPEESQYLIPRYWKEAAYPIDTIDRSDWISMSVDEPVFGRSYSESDIIKDWSGGVDPVTWQWNAYQVVARGTIPPDSTNPLWDGETAIGDYEDYTDVYRQKRDQDIIFNVNAFYNEFVDESDSSAEASSADFLDKTASASFLMMAPGAAATEESLAAVAMTSFQTLSIAADATEPRSAASASLPYPSGDMYTYDYTFFTGMAELTGGKVVDMVCNTGGTVPIAGDLNDDGNIDELDLRIVLTWFARPVDRYNPQSSIADIDQNLFVDNGDVALIRANWTDENKIAPILGDIDYNWVVDQADLTQVMQWYGLPVDPGAQHSYHADMNADGFIDDLDVAIVENAINNPAPTCRDDVQNGDETDVDCGGATCIACVEGKSCLVNSDCQSDNCDPVTATCDLPVGFDVVASLVVDNDWGAGYCATLNVTNFNAAATTSWSVIVDPADGTLFSTWNANFTTGAGGDVYVTPVEWNAAIQSGQTISSVGFCLNRNGSTGTATVVDANGTY